MSFTLTREQWQAVTDRGGGLLVSAAAGSGKTRVLVERLLSRVEEGTDIDRFLIITYTKAAAAELRSRIVAELSDRLVLHPEDSYLRRQATLVYGAQISTIHAFCSRFLQEEGHRLDLDHDFRVCDEGDAQVLMTDTLNEVLDRCYETIEPGSSFALLVDTMSAGRDDSRLMQIVLDIRGRIQSHPDPERWLDEQEKAFALTDVADAGKTVWGELLLQDARQQADYWAKQMEEALSLCGQDAVLEKAYGATIEETLRGLRRFSAATERGWDAARQEAEIPFLRAGSSRKCEDLSALERVKRLRTQCKKRMEKLAARFPDSSEGLLSGMRAVYPAIEALFQLVRDFEKAYSAAKRQRGLLDFTDLEHLTAKLLIDEEGQPTSLARSWGGRFTEVMVDEYQDTNAIQNAIFTALSQEGQKLFMVGDVKQSIYRFRLADPTIFLGKYLSYRPWEEAEEGEPRRVLLSQNFRSRPQVLEGCNYLFRSVMSRDFGEMDYTEKEALIPGGSFPALEDPRYALELDILDCSESSEEAEGPKDPRDRVEARFAARRIREMLDEGFPVSDGDGGLRPARYGDFVILLRSPGTALHHYAEELGNQDIPWSADGRGDFFGATEIQVALSILRIIDNPRQDVPLIATLRSAVYAFSADRLSEIRAAAPEEDFYTALTRDGGKDTKAFLQELGRLRERAGEESASDLIWDVYDQTNLLGIYGALDEGETRRANLLLLAQLAQDFEKAGHKGLFPFLTQLQRLQESEGALRLPGGESSAESVHIMSIHKSKGLEFPIVLLCGLARKLNRQDMAQPILFHPKLGVGPKRLDLERMIEYPTLARLAVQRQLDYELSAEELRLLYVAMTRAQEKLILSCTMTRGRAALEELMPAVGTPVEPQALRECNSMAEVVLLAALARPEALSLREGAFCPVAAGTEFGPEWDIHWIQQVDTAHSANRSTQPAVEERSDKDPEALMNVFSWRYPHAGDVALPSKLTATQLKGRGLDEEIAEEASEGLNVKKTGAEGGKAEGRSIARGNFRRPRFAAEKLGLTPAQRGTAHHLAMQYIDFGQADSLKGVKEEIRRLVREGFLTVEQGEAVDAGKLYAFFSSPLGREVLASGTLRREFKFSILAPARRYFAEAGESEQVLLQGVVDCYFEDLEGITVLDFKTDRVFGQALLERAEAYRPQLTAYADALSEITGRPVYRRILWFFSEDRAVELSPE